jgi:hypothetical protein
MGRQINFYTLEDDEHDFWKYVTSDSSARCVASASPTPEPLLLAALPQDNDLPFVWRYEVYLWRPAYPLALTAAVMEVGPQQGKVIYRVDDSASGVIQFARSGLAPDGTMLIRGRLWADMRYVENGQWVEKPAEFARWFDELAAWIRRNFVRLPDGPPGFRIGRQALRWHNAGGRLQG